MLQLYAPFAPQAVEKRHEAVFRKAVVFEKKAGGIPNLFPKLPKRFMEKREVPSANACVLLYVLKDRRDLVSPVFLAIQD